ncbi:MAG TPA: NAD-dependent epimerase/dehydratase family protein [Steroidobacteraceae bacterium]
MNSTPKIALVAGATGMVGGELLKVLLDAPDYARVYAVTRRPFGREHPRLANRVVIFPRMAEQLKGLAVTDAYCCIGTTIAQAGSEEAFRDVDLETVLQFAQAARALQATRFIVVSSVGADVGSKKFYLRTKGEMEEAVISVGFPSVDILQPSLLSGPRKQVRPLELVGRVLAPLVNPMLTGKREIYRAIPADVVARGMLGASRRGARGVYRYTHAGIRQLAALRPPQANAVQTAKNRPG